MECVECHRESEVHPLRICKFCTAPQWGPWVCEECKTSTNFPVNSCVSCDATSSLRVQAPDGEWMSVFVEIPSSKIVSVEIPSSKIRPQFPPEYIQDGYTCRECEAVYDRPPAKHTCLSCGSKRINRKDELVRIDARSVLGVTLPKTMDKHGLLIRFRDGSFPVVHVDKTSLNSLLGTWRAASMDQREVWLDTKRFENRIHDFLACLGFSVKGMRDRDRVVEERLVRYGELDHYLIRDIVSLVGEYL